MVEKHLMMVTERARQSEVRLAVAPPKIYGSLHVVYHPFFSDVAWYYTVLNKNLSFEDYLQLLK